MQLSDIPNKLLIPFAEDGGKNTIPTESQIGITGGRASLTDGFPPVTRIPTTAGGIPPFGLDMNGILYAISAICRWQTSGAGFPYDSDFATDSLVSGYPAGARILRDDAQGYWLNTTDDNETDPSDAGAAAAGWVPDFAHGVASVTMTSSHVTLTPTQYGLPIIEITGTLTTNLNLIFPDISGGWIVIDKTTGGFAITTKTSAGTGVVIPKLLPISVCCDSTDVSLISRRIVTPQDFGAKGDGVTDDTAAIQSAINSGAKIVYFPAATYRVSSVNLVSNQALVGDGSNSVVLATNATADTPTGVFYAESESNIEISNIKFQGVNRPEDGNPANQDGDRGISLADCSNISIHDCESSGFWSFGIVCSDCSDIKITDNYVHDIGNQSCIAISNGCLSAVVANNLCKDGKLYGIEAENQTKKAAITGNVIENCVAGVAVVNGGQHISVTGNNIFNCNNTNTISGSSGIGLYYVGDNARPLYDVATNGNVVSDNDAYALIMIGGHQNLVFSGNTFQNRASSTTGKLVEIVLGTGTRKDVLFSGNIFDCFNEGGAFIADTISGYKFVGNQILNPSGNVFTLLNSCTDNVFEIPKIHSASVPNIASAETLSSDLTNYFYSADKSEQLVLINGSGNFERNVKSLRAEKIIGVYWCVNSNASTGNWILKINGVNLSGLVAAVAGEEVWTYTQTNILLTAGASTLIAAANTIGNAFGDYFKFRLVVL